ncbi:MAG: toprim domain-containing protein [Dehalococcoidia bacterium]|nr:toprim domain-containing protein [Dehalococcoidia bacterium]
MYDVISIRRSNPIGEVIATSGVELQSRGRRLVGHCPFHRDGEPSLVVYPDNQSYFCFGCGAGGDVIDFLGRLHGVGFKEAASMLAVPVAGQRVNTSRPQAEPASATVVSPKAAEVIDASVWFWHDALWRSGEALAYLESRGISPAVAERCRLGFGLAGLADHLRRGGLSLGLARGIGLLSGERDVMLGRLVIPDLSGGRATWLTGRSVDGRQPRYLNLRSGTPLLGLERVRANHVIVTEGPFDWLTAVQWDLPAVALLGSQASRATVKSLARFSRVYLALDNDEAGHRAAGQLLQALGGRAGIVGLPRGIKDLNDLGRQPYGRAAFWNCLQEANTTKEKLWDTHDAAPALRAA